MTVIREFETLRAENPGAILFFQLGDFFEMFREDAELVSRILSMTLTSRYKNTENEVPMCGFPVSVLADYIEALVTKGYKIAIAEQFKNPETNEVHRKVVRVVTPGTTFEKGALPHDRNNFLAAISAPSPKTSGRKMKKSTWALAFADLSTGEFRTAQFDSERAFLDEIFKVSPAEILIDPKNFADKNFCEKLPSTSLQTVRKTVSEKMAAEILEEMFGNFEVFGIEKIQQILRVCGSVLHYLQQTQKNALPHISKIIKYTNSEIMTLDAQTFRHLEVFEPLFSGERSPVLFDVFQKTATSMGARTLRSWVARPLLSAAKINARLEGVDFWVENFESAENLFQYLKKVPDLPRILGRLAAGLGSGRDAALLRNGLEFFPQIQKLVAAAPAKIISENAEILGRFTELFDFLEKHLIEFPPAQITAGGIFRDGCDDRLDQLREISKNSQTWLDNFLQQKKAQSGIANLRVKFSKNFGFCLEVSKTAAKNVPTDWIRRQTLVNAERFSTPELAQYENDFLSSQTQICELEYQKFVQLRERIVGCIPNLQAASEKIAKIDALLSFARTSQKWRWTRPEISETSKILSIKNGYHPVVKSISSDPFIENSLEMDAKTSTLHLITGPNMAGKSTFLRQNAIIILIGQIGCRVPASSAKFGVFDRLFTRVGASDNLAGGKSTFFVEMSETAAILSVATDRSFVILDEIGRGTSTFDGISLAWSIAEFLHSEIGACTLFATHYHELTELSEILPRADNFHVSCQSGAEEIIFLRKILPGAVADSFGIEVAKTAGIPPQVVARSREILAKLESGAALNPRPTLFSTPKFRAKPEPAKVETSPLLDFIKTVHPDEMSPKQALEKWYELQKIKA